MIERKHAAVLLVAVLVIAAGWYIGGFERSDEDVRPRQPPHNYVTFVGDVGGNESFSLDGSLHMNGLSENHLSFQNVSVRLYGAGGNLLEAQCLGTLSMTNSRNVSMANPTFPEYVVFASPWFWTRDPVDRLKVDYFERRGGEYRYERWFAPSDPPVDVRRHQPCQ